MPKITIDGIEVNTEDMSEESLNKLSQSVALDKVIKELNLEKTLLTISKNKLIASFENTFQSGEAEVDDELEV